MTYRMQYDNATPLPEADQPNGEACMIYAGGSTPHVWTDADIESQGADRARMPTWAHWPGRDGKADGAAFRAWLEAHHVPKDCAVAIDMETSVDAPYLYEMYDALGLWTVLAYGSTGTLFANPEPDGWYPADWTGHPHLFAHPLVLATQYAAGRLGQTPGVYDLSLLSPALTLWNSSQAGLVHYYAPGNLSLREVAQMFRTSVASILQVTLNHGHHHFWPGLTRYIDNHNLDQPLPDGTGLTIRPGPDNAPVEPSAT